MIDLNKIKDQIAKQMPTAERWRCPKCKGQGEYVDEYGLPGHVCESCYGTGLKNAVEDVLIEIIGELWMANSSEDIDIEGSALFPMYNELDENGFWIVYNGKIKNTKGDHLAAAVLRILEVMAYEKEILPNYNVKNCYGNPKIKDVIRAVTYQDWKEAILDVVIFCKNKDIPLDRHIEARIRYEQQLQL